MRITSPIPTIDSLNTTASLQKNDSISTDIKKDNLDEQSQLPKLTLQKAVDKLNEFMEVHNNNLKFVYHEGLKEYYAEVVDSQTNEIIREIPSKELLDAYYEMQKIIGNIVDEKI